MSAGFKCDGCGKSVAGEITGSWVCAEVWSAAANLIVKGEFCSADCLARYLASDSLDRAIKRGTAAFSAPNGEAKG